MICSRIIWMLCVLISTICPILFSFEEVRGWGWQSNIFLSCLPADTFCSGTYCSGSWAYCCGLNDDICCYSLVYDYWWFWFIWVVILCAIISCSVYCCRRRRLQANYYLVPDQSARGYGTTVSVSSTSTTVAPPAYPATQYQMPPSAPTYPPQYQPSEKPPGYVP